MRIERRGMMAGMAGLATLGLAPPIRAGTKGAAMYGLIGNMTAVEGQRDTLTAILLEGLGRMPGCLSYIIAEDATDPDAIWVTEVWDSEASHKASLQLPQVRSAIAKGRPLIAGMDSIAATRSARGTGLVGMTS